MGLIENVGNAPEAAHLFVAIFFALGFVPARFLLNSLVYKRLAIRMLYGPAVSLMADVTRKAKFIKCTESMWKLTYYACVQMWVISILKQTPWAMNTKEYFRGWPNQDLGLPMKLFYMCQCGFYLYSIGALLAWETRRKDFSIMFSHHIITSVLIGYSYLTSFFRIGTVILALHDTSDVFLEAAKVSKYAGMEMAASLFFACFALSWFLLRLIFFPFWIIKTSSYHLIESLMKSGQFSRSSYYIFNVMLLTLLVFHIYWWKLICAMIIRQLQNQGKVGEDIRSDSEDEES
ncbi:ASC1-like protein 3 [Phalaenopsis equestris]|uniref:ASC1-like protein 3 n=1 Tax=Phalaenopsis equestris TaxID=78828 RepID=UPI0009E627B1|nr:ASC1-like protein 3 [Phalaenopsis equestris]